MHATEAPSKLTHSDSLKPDEVARVVCATGIKKASLDLDDLIIKSIYGGCLLSMGATLADMVSGGSPALVEANPGLSRLITGLIFPVGLTMIIMTGSELFTANVMYLTISTLERKTSLWDLSRVWFVSFFGNLAGCLFYMAILTFYAGELTTDPYKSSTVDYATSHMVTPGWHQVFLRGIACNWAVNLAVWISLAGRDLVSKIYGIHTPLLVFASMGYDHVIANMYSIPLAMKNGAHIGVGYYIWKSMIPSLIGNILGGTIFIALPFWWLNMFKARKSRGGEAPADKSAIGQLPGGSGSLPLPEYELQQQQPQHPTDAGHMA